MYENRNGYDRGDYKERKYKSSLLAHPDWMSINSSIPRAVRRQMFIQTSHFIVLARSFRSVMLCRSYSLA
jgi:hypothetical protein